jgi:hypothetical protein
MSPDTVNAAADNAVLVMQFTIWAMAYLKEILIGAAILGVLTAWANDHNFRRYARIAAGEKPRTAPPSVPAAKCEPAPPSANPPVDPLVRTVGSVGAPCHSAGWSATNPPAPRAPVALPRRGRAPVCVCHQPPR